ncbi:dihydroxyacetone kinase family protein [Aquincola sp. J276]|uniref:dihydroxyacetone kinase family protein n=1 Tax=Aquincola sp. J276 TaxID=2898432 RepID=UPI0021517F89|nr:DAK2 domain-containing protein [Aquincola sp. J276]MCR5867697.1 DAK2 domain-containing protein [Aquincola sp. J276]
MDPIGQDELAGLFARLREVFTQQRETLIALDGKVGDSDLGITMNKGFIAAHEAVAAAGADDGIGKRLQMAGMAIAKAAPSTMGTLTATGFMRGGKALAVSQAAAIGTAELAAFWRAYHDGVVERGKAKPGDKTLVDVLGPLAASLEASAAAGLPLLQALDEAAQVAAQALEATKTMTAQHGKAAVFREQSVGLQDAGATVGFLIIQTMRDHVLQAGRSAAGTPS